MSQVNAHPNEGGPARDATGLADLDLSRLDPGRVPGHVGLIMDGNGRWARERGLPRTAGHAAGEAALFDCVEGALAAGVRWLSAYAFSTENWSREPEEVEFLMWFNEDLLLRRRDALSERGVRFHFAGYLDDPRIPERNRAHMAEAERVTAGNDRLHLVLAFNYGGRDEIVRAARALAAAVGSGELAAADIDEGAVSGAMFIPEMPDPDLIVRTSGEMRMSNFWLWSGAYAELIFTETRWPDFGARSLIDCLVEYQRRRRRFGGRNGPGGS